MISAFITKIVSIIVTPVIMFTGWLGMTPDKTELGATIPVSVALFETSLSSAITADATSMTLVSATTKDGTTLATGTYAFILDEGTANEEFVTATCVATACTSMTRGLSVINGTSTITALKKAHRRGASVKITDAPQLLILSRILNGNETIPNVLKYNSAPSHTYGQNELTTWDKAKDYIDGVAIAGAPNAATTTKGISKLSVDPASSTNPIAVGDNDTRVSPVSLATLTAGQVAALAGTSGTPSSTNKYVTDLDDRLSFRIFGDASDGDVTISATTTLSSDKFYDDLIVNAGVSLITGGYKIYANTVTINGIISYNGNNGGAGGNGTYVEGTCSAGVAGTTTAMTSGTVFGSTNPGFGIGGGRGDSGTDGNAPTATSSTNVLVANNGTAGGTGGSGSFGAGTSGGSTSTATIAPNSTKDFWAMVNMFNANGYLKTGGVASGGGGGRGGTTGSYQGCGGGGGSGGHNGGIVWVSSKTITNNGSIQAKGGTGGNGGNGGYAAISGGGGGGGGGNGGVIVLIYQTYTGSGTKLVTGGLGGTGGTGGSATNGNNGATGTVITLDI